MAQTIELGLDTFGDVTVGADGQPLSQAQTLRNLVVQGELADQVGLDFIGVGEHHRPDFSVSAPEVVLGAIAARTSRIHLGSAVTVLSSDDPVRVFERFSTVNALSNGRAEVIVGRGSFTESFPLFGYDLANYEEHFEENLNLFVELLKQEPVTWKGRLRAPLTNQLVYPPTEGRLYTWVGVGGSPESVVRAAYYGLPLMLAIIGGSPARFAPWAELYRERLERFKSRCSRSARIHRVTSPTPTNRRRRNCGRTTPGDDEPHRPRARLAADRPRRVRAGGRPRARCLSALRRPWRRRSSRP